MNFWVLRLKLHVLLIVLFVTFEFCFEKEELTEMTHFLLFFASLLLVFLNYLFSVLILNDMSTSV